MKQAQNETHSGSHFILLMGFGLAVLGGACANGGDNAANDGAGGNDQAGKVGATSTATTNSGNGGYGGSGGGSETASSSGAGGIGAGEQCADASNLVAQSQASQIDGFESVVSGSFGTNDDYNPLASSGKLPGCSQVFNANGYERVYALTLEPEETLKTRLEVFPDTAVPAIYLLEDCTTVSWPDYDKSGMCGNNEYMSSGYCGPVGCYPIDFEFIYPKTLDGIPTKARTFFIVVDQVEGQDATGFSLHWSVE